MTPQEEKRIAESGRGIAGNARLRLVATADRRSAEMRAFCAKIAALVKGVSVAEEDGAGHDDPAIWLPNGVRYQAVPQGNELEPFMEALAGGIPRLAPELRSRLEAMRLPAVMALFVLPGCLHCPLAVRRLISIAEASRLVQLTVIDAGLFAEAADRNRITTVPTLLLEDHFRWSGTIAAEEIVSMLVARDPIALGAASLEMLLKEGEARRLAEMMAERHALFPALLDLLCSEQWPVRLGAMVAVEELAGFSAHLAQEALELWWDRESEISDAVRGDLLFLSGEIGAAAAACRIRKTLEGRAGPEIREAAREALERLAQRGPA